MKKILAFIMAFLVLGFSMIPCADDASNKDMDADKYEFSQSIPQDENHEDACSPFCICTCCTGFSLTCTSTILSQIVIPHRISHSTFITARTHSIALPIWQPPQLV